MTNFGVLNDNDAYAGSGGTNQTTDQHLSALLTKAGKTWKSYQEDIDLMQETPPRSSSNVPLPQDQRTSPIVSFSGVFAPQLPE